MSPPPPSSKIGNVSKAVGCAVSLVSPRLLPLVVLPVRVLEARDWAPPVPLFALLQPPPSTVPLPTSLISIAVTPERLFILSDRENSAGLNRRGKLGGRVSCPLQAFCMSRAIHDVGRCRGVMKSGGEDCERALVALSWVRYFVLPKMSKYFSFVVIQYAWG